MNGEDFRAVMDGTYVEPEDTEEEENVSASETSSEEKSGSDTAEE